MKSKPGMTENWTLSGDLLSFESIWAVTNDDVISRHAQQSTQQGAKRVAPQPPFLCERKKTRVCPWLVRMEVYVYLADRPRGSILGHTEQASPTRDSPVRFWEHRHTRHTVDSECPVQFPARGRAQTSRIPGPPSGRDETGGNTHDIYMDNDTAKE